MDQRKGAKMSDEEVFLLEARGLSKYYGAVRGLDNVDITLRAGEIMAVIGDNGAGKSTLIKCLSGAENPDGGEIFIKGKKVVIPDISAARDLGIETVFQDLAVSPALDIASNMFLTREKRKKGFLGSVLRMLDSRGMQKTARRALEDLGITTLQDVKQPVENLSGGQRQAVAVARAAAFGSGIVILDEPTAALGVRESGQVIKLIQNLAEKGLGVILISHDMPVVFQIAHRVHVQRLGRRVAVMSPESVGMEEAVAVMTGAQEWKE